MKHATCIFIQSKDIANNVYTSNWITLQPQQRKCLSVIMMISQKGKLICFYGIFALSMDTFT